MFDQIKDEGDSTAMSRALTTELATLVASGEMDAAEASEILAWLGSPEMSENAA